MIHHFVVKRVISSVASLPSEIKTMVVFVYDLLGAAFCFYLALVLRHGDFHLLHQNKSHEFMLSLFLAVFIQGVVFYTFGLYRGIWRYSSTPDLLRLIKGVSVAEVATVLVLFFFNRIEFFPRTTFLINWPLLVIFLGGGRLFYRLLRDQYNRPPQDVIRTAIWGTGSVGEQLFRETRKNHQLKMQVVIYFESDKKMQGKTLHGVSIVSPNIKEFGFYLLKYQLQRIILAESEFNQEILPEVTRICSEHGVQLKITPHFMSLMRDKETIYQIRDIAPEDLLKRKMVTLDNRALGELIFKKVVFISGAGGFIGKEICLQLSRYKPSKMIFYDLCEFNLYELDQVFRKMKEKISYDLIVGDVRDREKLDILFSSHRPELIFHAAALKHVPLMELNIAEAVKTNVRGTYVLGQLAQKYKVEKFVLISSDKAINPSSVMGTTKRMAEMVCQHFQEVNKDSPTQFITVRFGNVFGSTGSVIPLFKKQIKEGGPLTVTHPEMKRFFMDISEATQLVLQAAAIGSKGEVLVLEMGPAIKILDLAKQMINLAGLTVGKDIDIEFINLRAGEKLEEELFSKEEKLLPTAHPMVHVAQVKKNSSGVHEMMMKIFDAARTEDDVLVRELMATLVPEYSPDETESSRLEQSSSHGEKIFEELVV